jgi:hypothetical protein
MYVMVSIQRISGQRSRQRSMVFLLVSTLVVLLGGVITLLWQQQHRQLTQADSAYVVGPPTLPAATVNSILADTPMAGTGTVIEEASRNTNIDDAFALGVWWTETNDGAAGVGLSYRNPGGVRSSAEYAVGGGGYTIYPSYAAAIDDWFNIVQSRYIDRGLTSVYTICYPYVGTSSAGSWANKVFNLMVRYHAMAPAPTPPPAPTPIPTPKPRDWQQEQPITIVQPKPIRLAVPLAPKQQPVPVSAMLSVLSANKQDVVVSIGLLGSVMLAGFGIIARRRVQIAVASTSASLPITTGLLMESLNVVNMPSLSADLSSVPNYSTSSLVAPEFEPLEAILEPVTAPVQAISEPTTAPILAVSGGGLLTRFGGPAVGPRRPVTKTPILKASAMKTPIMQFGQLSNIDDEEHSIIPLAFDGSYDQGPTTTAGLPSVRPGISLPVRHREGVLELMAVGKMPEEERPKGLLSRYAG